jgi:hypothetical protein
MKALRDVKSAGHSTDWRKASTRFLFFRSPNLSPAIAPSCVNGRARDAITSGYQKAIQGTRQEPNELEYEE